jgi:hypothetical protein
MTLISETTASLSGPARRRMPLSLQADLSVAPAVLSLIIAMVGIYYMVRLLTLPSVEGYAALNNVDLYDAQNIWLAEVFQHLLFMAAASSVAAVAGLFALFGRFRKAGLVGLALSAVPLALIAVQIMRAFANALIS